MNRPQILGCGENARSDTCYGEKKRRSFDVGNSEKEEISINEHAHKLIYAL